LVCVTDSQAISAAVIVAVFSLTGIALSIVYQRDRELRQMRRKAYVDWYRAARFLGHLPGPLAPDSSPHLPSKQQKPLLNFRRSPPG
jgi:hypothetical protein